MTTKTPREVVDLPAMTKDESWIIRVDDDIWGCAHSKEHAEKIIKDVADVISEHLKEVVPHWQINLDTKKENTIKVKCLHPGYVYNSSWTAHTVSFNVVSMLEPSETLPKKKVEEPVEEKKVEEPVEEKKVEEPVEEKKVEETAEEKKVEEPVEEKKVEETTEEKKVDETAEEKKEETKENKKIIHGAAKTKRKRKK